SSVLQVGTNPSSTVLLRDIFFTPPYSQVNGIDSILQGARLTPMQEIDGIIVEDVRSFLFGAPTAMVLHDLAALNMQRARDHGIPGYNAVRVAYGLNPIANFEDLPMTANSRNVLQTLYDSTD